MRAPLIVVITTFSFCTAGMMLMPGVDPDGNPYRLNIFDAFYQMAITLTTVGFTEAPYPFSYPQRMWMTMSMRITLTLMMMPAMGVTAAVGIVMAATMAADYLLALAGMVALGGHGHRGH